MGDGGPEAELSIKMDSALLVYAAKLRAIDHRQLARGGQPRRDALRFANYIDGRVSTSPTCAPSHALLPGVRTAPWVTVLSSDP